MARTSCRKLLIPMRLTFCRIVGQTADPVLSFAVVARAAYMIEFDFGLGESVDLLRQTVRDFARDAIAPRAEEIDRSNHFPRDLWPQLGSLGLLGLTVEEEFGGSGMGYLEHVVAMEEISR